MKKKEKLVVCEKKFNIMIKHSEASNPLLLMNHCLTYKSLACLHRLCVMTTPGMAGRDLRKHCVRVHVHTCLHVYICVCVCMCVCRSTRVRLGINRVAAVSQLLVNCQSNDYPTRQSRAALGMTTGPPKSRLVVGQVMNILREICVCLCVGKGVFEKGRVCGRACEL